MLISQRGIYGAVERVKLSYPSKRFGFIARADRPFSAVAPPSTPTSALWFGLILAGIVMASYAVVNARHLEEDRQIGAGCMTNPA